MTTVLYSPDHGSAFGDIVDVVVLVIEVVTDVGLKRGEETVLDVGIAVIEARIAGVRIQLVAGKARIQARCRG